MITIKSKREIELMREASKITALTYEMIEKNIKVGMSTYELDNMAYDFIKSQGGIPAQKGVSKWPKRSSRLSRNFVYINK